MEPSKSHYRILDFAMLLPIAPLLDALTILSLQIPLGVQMNPCSA